MPYNEIEAFDRERKRVKVRKAPNYADICHFLCGKNYIRCKFCSLNVASAIISHNVINLV